MDRIREHETDNRRSRNRRAEDMEHDGESFVALVTGLLFGIAIGAFWTWAAAAAGLL